MPRLPQSKVITIISLLTIIGGILVIINCVFSIQYVFIISAFSGIRVNAGLCFILMGVALLLFQYRAIQFYGAVYFILSLLVTLIGLVTLSQFLFHINAGLDQLFLADHSPQPPLGSPGRMAFISALNFSLLGLGFLLLMANKGIAKIIAQYFFHLVTLLSVIALIGFLYGVSVFYALFYLTAMPTATASLFFIFSLGASMLNPSLGISRLFTGKLVGNQVARRLFAFIIFMIVLFGSLRRQANNSELFSSVDIGMCILAVGFLLISLVIIWNTANWLNKIDKDRSEAEECVKSINTDLEKRVDERTALLQESEEKYRSLIEQASDAIFVLDFKGMFTEVNASMCKMIGYTRAELLHLNVAAIVDPEELKNDPVPKFFAGMEQIIRERTFVGKNGLYFTVEINVKIFSDDMVMVIARDITDRKSIEAELREAELKFRTIAEKSMVGIYMVQNGKFTYVNPRFAHIFGYEPAELSNTVPLETIIHEDYREITTEHVRKRMAGEVESVHYETKGRKKDGTPNWVEFYGSRATINGEPTIIGSMIDITERKQAEEELRSSEQKYKLLFESNPMPMWMIAKDDLTIIAVNEAALKHYGYTREEILNSSVRAMRPPEDAEMQMEGYLKDMDGSLSIVRHLKKDGTIMYVQIFAHDIIFEGRSVRLSLTNDITERLNMELSLQKSEANLQTILNTTDTVYALFDRNLRVLTFNQKAIEFAKNVYHHDAAKGDALMDHFPEDQFPELNQFAREALQGNNVNYEFDHHWADGSVQWYYVRLFPIINDEKEILGILIAIYDITETKNAEQDLKSAYKRIQDHMNSIKDMAWKQSHLIRSPLANLKGLASMLNTDMTDHKTVTQHIQTELDRMDSIIIEMAEEVSNQDGDDNEQISD